MAYTFTFNGVNLEYAPLADDYDCAPQRVGTLEEAIDGTLVDLSAGSKLVWRMTVVVGGQRSFLLGLYALASFVFVDHDGGSYTVKMTGLSFKSYPIPEVGTATVELREV